MANNPTFNPSNPYGGGKQERQSSGRETMHDIESGAEKAGEQAKSVGEKAKDAASNVATKAKDAASNVATKASDMASSAASSVRDAASSVGDKAEQGVAAVGSGMKSLAGTIREKAPHSGILGSASSTVADSLESGGRYLQEEGLSGMAEDMTDAVRKYPIASLFIAMGLGFFVARALRS